MAAAAGIIDVRAALAAAVVVIIAVILASNSSGTIFSNRADKVRKIVKKKPSHVTIFRQNFVILRCRFF